MFELIANIWNILKEADERLGFRKIIMYTTYVIIVVSIFNWKSILFTVTDYTRSLDEKRHEKDMEMREKINSEIHPYLMDLRAKSRADRVLLFEFHNSITNLIGIPFRYITLTDHAVPYGTSYTPKYSDINSELIGSFIRDLKVDMFRRVDDMDTFRNFNPVVSDVLNSNDVIVSCYQYMSVLGKPLGILVLEWNTEEDLPDTEKDWNKVRGMCSQATQDLNNIILKHKDLE